MDGLDIAKSIKNTQQNIDRLEQRLTCPYLDRALHEYEQLALIKLKEQRAALGLLMAVLSPQND